MMLCSNSKVKSKPPRQSRTPGPKESSMSRGQVGADMFVVEASCDTSGISGNSSARYCCIDVGLGNVWVVSISNRICVIGLKRERGYVPRLERKSSFSSSVKLPTLGLASIGSHVQRLLHPQNARRILKYEIDGIECS